jgi:hypothetical protein
MALTTTTIRGENLMYAQGMQFAGDGFDLSSGPRYARAARRPTSETFTLSDLRMGGIDAATEEPAVRDGQVVARTTELAVSIDHRVLDGPSLPRSCCT